ncbi:MAG TPA: gamma-glutamyl-gamma-aminobutyrate hydrolase family protein, partial [Accumulibacter sp.]|nr:gamma-glutamyl-gamma-aminobutyrate hydrolase family protein [Accumulibacter sp.]
MRPRPLVGLPSDRRMLGPHPTQTVGEKYIRAVIDGAGRLPLMIPSLDPATDLRATLAELDG